MKTHTHTQDTQVSSQRPNDTDEGYSRRITDTLNTHTPGPWKTVLSASTRAVTTANEAPKQATICRLFSECVAFEPGEFEANAQLIAAAPELLQALKAMMNRYGDKSEHPFCDASISARAAISKAESRA